MELDIEAHFRQQLYKSYEENKLVLLPKEEYQNIISQLLEATATTKKTPHKYYLLEKYEVLECGYVEKFIRKREDNEDIFYSVSIEETLMSSSMPTLLQVMVVETR